MAPVIHANSVSNCDAQQTQQFGQTIEDTGEEDGGDAVLGAGERLMQRRSQSEVSATRSLTGMLIFGE